MLEKIKNALDAKVEKELSEMKKRIEDLETYVSENEDTENETLMLKVLTSKNTLKRLSKGMPELIERDANAKQNASRLFNAANDLKREKTALTELKSMEKNLMKIVDTLGTGTIKEVVKCFDTVQYGVYGAKFTANSDNGKGGVKNNLLDEFMENIKRELENIKRGISQSENILNEYPKIKKLLKV